MQNMVFLKAYSAATIFINSMVKMLRGIISNSLKAVPHLLFIYLFRKHFMAL